MLSSSNATKKRPIASVVRLVRWVTIGGLILLVSACLSDDEKCPKGSKLVKADDDLEDPYFYDVCIVTLIHSVPSTTDDTENDAGSGTDDDNDSDVSGESNSVNGPGNIDRLSGTL